MTKRIIISLLAIVLLMTMSLGLVACNGEYGSLPIKYKYKIDNSVPRLTGDLTADALKHNPNRGFSINAYMTADETGRSYAMTSAFPSVCDHEGHITKEGQSKTTQAYLSEQFELYKDYNPQIVVMTVFLTNYVEKDLTPSATSQILEMIKSFKRDQNKTNLVLKFAYQHTATDKVPHIDMVRAHMKKIGLMFENNINTINGLVSAIRLSFAGIDGNFENIPYTEHETLSLLDGFAQLLPDKLTTHTQAMNVNIKNAFRNPERLINMGFYNNHIDGTMNKYVSGGANKNTENYKQYVYQGIFNFNSARLSSENVDVSGKKVLAILKDGYYNHIDIESLLADAGEDSTIVDSWKASIITKRDLDRYNLPYYHEWFQNSQGASQLRSVYDYIRDFIGYNLAVTSLSFEKKVMPYNGKDKMHTIITYVITNFGMSAPIGIDRLEMYIKNNDTGAFIKDGQAITQNGFDVEELVSGGQVKITQKLVGDIDVAEGSSVKDPDKGHSIGLRLYSKHTYSNPSLNGTGPLYVRLSNAVKYENNVNWIYSTVK